jgi:hypothetical protein
VLTDPCGGKAKQLAEILNGTPSVAAEVVENVLSG